MTETEAIVKIDEALTSLEDVDARDRVLRWAVAKFIEKGNNASLPSIYSDTPVNNDPENRNNAGKTKNEMPGIALLDSGNFALTIRDLKAKSVNDKAVRLTVITIYAYCKLTGESSVSSKKILKPILEDWRAYSGNTRHVLAKHPGIVRNGDNLRLDQHARQEAENYIKEIQTDYQGK
jgi:hypothetical protein